MVLKTVRSSAFVLQVSRRPRKRVTVHRLRRDERNAGAAVRESPASRGIGPEPHRESIWRQVPKVIAGLVHPRRGTQSIERIARSQDRTRVGRRDATTRVSEPCDRRRGLRPASPRRGAPRREPSRPGDPRNRRVRGARHAVSDGFARLKSRGRGRHRERFDQGRGTPRSNVGRTSTSLEERIPRPSSRDTALIGAVVDRSR